MIKFLKSERKKELACYIFLAIITLLALTVVYELWNRNLYVPLSDSGDTLGALATAQNLVQNSSLNEYKELAAPNMMNISGTVQDYILSAFVMWIVSLFANDGALTLNLYYFLTFILTAESAFYVLRRIKVNRIWSLLGAYAFSFAPYHFFRAFGHIWITSYYVLPLGLLGVYYIMEGEIFDGLIFEKKNTLITNLKIFLKSNLFVTSLGAILVAMSSIYYAVFLAICYIFAIMYSVCKNKKKKYLASIFSVVLVALPILIMQFITALNASKIYDVNIYAERNAAEIRTFSLRLLPMILPIPCHRIPLLNNIVEYYYSQIQIYDEVYMEALGLVTTIAFIISCVCALTPLFDKISEIKGLCRLNVFLILVGLTDGINMFIGLFASASIRCYNRLSIFIAFISIMAMGLILSQKEIKIKKIRCIILVLGFLIITFDQTPYTLKESLDLDLNDFTALDSYEENEKQYLAQKEIIDGMEEQMPDGSMVLMLPLGDASNPSCIYKTKAYICSKDLRFNYQWVGRNNFNDRLVKNSFMQQIDIAIICGFQSVLIDKEYFTNREYDRIKEILEDEVGAEHSADNTSWVWYDLREYAKKVKNNYSKEEMAKIKDNYLSDDYTFFAQYRAYDGGLSYTEKVGSSEYGIALKSATQYGPYISLAAGEYHITYKGIGFESALFWVTSDRGMKEIDISNLYISDGLCEYDISLKKDTSNIEFLMRGESVEFELMTVEAKEE